MTRFTIIPVSTVEQHATGLAFVAEKTIGKSRWRCEARKNGGGANGYTYTLFRDGVVAPWNKTNQTARQMAHGVWFLVDGNNT